MAAGRPPKGNVGNEFRIPWTGPSPPPQGGPQAAGSGVVAGRWRLAPYLCVAAMVLRAPLPEETVRTRAKKAGFLGKKVKKSSGTPGVSHPFYMTPLYMTPTEVRTPKVDISYKIYIYLIIYNISYKKMSAGGGANNAI